MADKKITALTSLTATTKDASADLLHIIDFSAAPVNKKITIADLFDQVNTSTHIYGVSKTFEVGSTSTASSAFKVTTPDTTTLSSTKLNEVIINDDQSQFVDFTVKSASSSKAIHVDASYVTGSSGPSIVFINGDAGPGASATQGKVDFCVKGEGFDVVNPVIFSDASNDALGVGTNVLSGSYRMELHGDGVVVDTGTLTSGATSLTMTSTAAINANDKVFGEGIAPGTTVASITNSTTAVLSANSTASGAKNLTFVSASGTGHAAKIAGSIAMHGYEQIAIADGATTLSNAVPVHKLRIDGATQNVALTLSDTGAVDGQIKHIYVTYDDAGGNFRISNTNRVPGSVTMDLQVLGDSCSFIYDATSSNWIEVSSTATNR